MRPHVRLINALVAVALLAACADDDDETAATTSSTTEAPAPSSTTTTTAAATTSTSTAGAGPTGCTADDGATDTLVLTEKARVQADLDRDGRPDDLVLAADAAGRGVVEARYGAGGTAAVLISDEFFDASAGVRIATTRDVEGDGDLDAFVVAGAGASTDLYVLIGNGRCALVQPELEGSPNSFPVGGTVGNISGAECKDGRLILYSGQGDGQGGYTGEAVAYVLEDRTLVDKGATPFSASPDQAPGYGQFNC